MLKINVPESCVSFEDGIPVPGSFDASELDGNDSAEDDETKRKVVRLIMRQDSTHRMLLNTVVLPALHFQEKTTLKAVGILFTAFEGDGQAVSVQAKVCPAFVSSVAQADTVIDERAKRQELHERDRPDPTGAFWQLEFLSGDFVIGHFTAKGMGGQP